MTTPAKRKYCGTHRRLWDLGFPPGNDCGGDRCRHCPYPGCPCTHSCDRGWIDNGTTDGYDSVTRCPTCARAAKDVPLLISAGR